MKVKPAGVTLETINASSSSLCDNLPTGSRNLVCLFYEYISHVFSRSVATNQDLFKIFLELSSKIPQTVFFGIFGNDDQTVNIESLTDRLEFPRGKLLRRWAEHQMLDSESYWLLRRNLAHNIGLYGLMERLFNLTPLHPGCLVIDPRSGNTEIHQTCFGLPGDSLSEPFQSINSERGFNQSYFIFCFLRTMLIQKTERLVKRRSSGCQFSSRIPTDSHGLDDSREKWLTSCRPVPFRLTPNLAGLVCLPGAPATVGPLAASFTTAAQALMSAQRDHTLTSLYRTFLRRDYILWHRGRQSTVYAYQLLMSEQILNEQDEVKLQNPNESPMETGRPLSGSGEDESSPFSSCAPALVPELTNEQLINLINLTMDSMNSKLKVASDYSGTEPKSWKLIDEATRPTNMIHMSPNLLPWL
ncbi:unnamed protein product [Heterobilharzia americana]|nr:unnamed protein product [Heterobilharzia americana]